MSVVGWAGDLPAEVTQLQHASRRIDEQVLGLDVSVADVEVGRVQIMQSAAQLICEELRVRKCVGWMLSGREGTLT